jgi:hypothetical protein
MSFEKWLRKQKKRDDAIGDVARDFIDSKCRSIENSFEKYAPCKEAKVALIKAWIEFIDLTY